MIKINYFDEKEWVIKRDIRTIVPMIPKVNDTQVISLCVCIYTLIKVLGVSTLILGIYTYYYMPKIYMDMWILTSADSTPKNKTMADNIIVKKKINCNFNPLI